MLKSALISRCDVVYLLHRCVSLEGRSTEIYCTTWRVLLYGHLCIQLLNVEPDLRTIAPRRSTHSFLFNYLNLIAFKLHDYLWKNKGRTDKDRLWVSLGPTLRLLMSLGSTGIFWGAEFWGVLGSGKGREPVSIMLHYPQGFVGCLWVRREFRPRPCPLTTLLETKLHTSCKCPIFGGSRVRVHESIILDRCESILQFQWYHLTPKCHDMEHSTLPKATKTPSSRFVYKTSIRVHQPVDICSRFECTRKCGSVSGTPDSWGSCD